MSKRKVKKYATKAMKDISSIDKLIEVYGTD